MKPGQNNSVQSNSASRIKIAILASVLLHVLIMFVGWQNFESITISTLPKGQALMQVSINNIQPRVNNLIEQNIQPKQDQPVITKKEKPNPRNKSKKNIDYISTAVEKTGESSTPNITNYMVQYLETEFRTRFQYPLIAQKRGWQGKVIIAMNVNQAGNIYNINVKQSSGHDVLDNNAVKTFQKIGSVSGMNKYHNRDYRLNIPIIYKLIEG